MKTLLCPIFALSLLGGADQKVGSNELGKWAEWWAARRATFIPKSAEELRQESCERMRRYFESSRGHQPAP